MSLMQEKLDAYNKAQADLQRLNPDLRRGEVPGQEATRPQAPHLMDYSNTRGPDILDPLKNLIQALSGDSEPPMTDEEVALARSAAPAPAGSSPTNPPVPAAQAIPAPYGIDSGGFESGMYGKGDDTKWYHGKDIWAGM